MTVMLSLFTSVGVTLVILSAVIVRFYKASLEC